MNLFRTYIIFLFLLFPSLIYSQLVPDFRVNDDMTTGNQFLPKIGVAKDGSFVIVWRDSHNGSNIPVWPTHDSDAPDIFCSGHTHMPDGRLLVAGGHRDPVTPPPPCPQELRFRGLPFTYFFDPASQSWQVAGSPGPPHPMADGRWYPTVTTLGDGPEEAGLILAMSGFRKDISGCDSVINRDPEIYHPLNGWSFMEDQQLATQPFDALYTGAHVVPYGEYAGKVFYSMPMLQAHIFNPFPDLESGEVYWENGGINPRSTHRNGGNSALLPLLPGSESVKVLIIGGGNPSTKTAELINLADSSPQWTNAASMFIARRNSNIMVLPDDKVLVVGGNHIGDVIDPVFTAELYDPGKNEWTLLPEMNRPRVYHSVGIVMPDARVWVGGTAAAGIFERNIEVYSPGYLFEGERPVITQAPNNINYGTQFGILTSHQVSAIRLIRLSSVTHSTNFEQRSVGLSYVAGPINGDYPYSVTTPANSNIAPPGYYMLFVLRPKSVSLSGETAIPSEAKIVKLSY